VTPRGPFDQSIGPNQARVLAVLMAAAEPTGPHAARMVVTATYDELAERAQTSRETVSRILRRLRDLGLAEAGYGQVTLLFTWTADRAWLELTAEQAAAVSALRRWYEKAPGTNKGGAPLGNQNRLGGKGRHLLEE
jgi:DNA-binding MarR family transcriptional regulator